MAPNYDILSQPFNLTDINGQPIEANTYQIDYLQHIAVSTATIFATQFGLTVAVLAIMLLTARSSKYRTLAFHINVLALLCNIFRCALECAVMDSLFTSFPVVVLGHYDLPDVHRAMVMSVSVTILTLVMFILIEIALFVQVRVVTGPVRARLQYIVLTPVALTAVIAVGWRINLVIINIKATIYVDVFDDSMAMEQEWAQRVANITAIISIGISTIIFSLKVLDAIRSRHSMGIKAFGSMQILFIIGCQTLLLPLIFAILAYFVLHGVQLQSFVETLVVIFLPLSGIWSSANNNASIATGHPGAMLSLPSYRSDESRLLANQASDASPTASTRPPPSQINPSVRREHSFWAQYGSRDSVMMDEFNATENSAGVHRSVPASAFRMESRM